MTLRSIIFLVITLVLLSACKTQIDSSSSFDPTMFENAQYDVSLGFDLRNDDEPIAGLVINAKNVTAPINHTIALPFESSSFEPTDQLFSTWGSFPDSTIINYYLTPTTNGTYSIGIVPTFQTVLSNYYDFDDIESSVALVRIGAERVFVYRYPEKDPRRPNWVQRESLIANTELDAIGVVYPKGAIPIGIRDTQQTAIPTPFPFRNGKARFYPANRNKARVEALEVKYQLPPTDQQKHFVDLGSKLFAVILIPLIKLFRKKASRQKHKILVYTLFGIQIIILLFLVVTFIRSWSGPNISAFIDMFAVIIGGILAYVLLLQDNEANTKQK